MNLQWGCLYTHYKPNNIYFMKTQPIEIHEYSVEWAQEFLRIGRELRLALSDVAIRIDHIGSTSVPGLAAKPVIDLQISIPALEPLEAFLNPIESLGYVWRSENPDLTKRYFRERPHARRTHIHVRKSGSWRGLHALLFRDYLRSHAVARDRYADVKRELAAKYRNEREKYTDAKNPIIWEITIEADRWAANTGWEPGPSDA